MRGGWWGGGSAAPLGPRSLLLPLAFLPGATCGNMCEDTNLFGVVRGYGAGNILLAHLTKMPWLDFVFQVCRHCHFVKVSPMIYSQLESI